MDNILNKYNDNLIGYSFIVSNNKETLYQKYYGLKNIDTKENIDINTIYRIASISKTIASLGIMILLDQGKLNLDNDISDLLGYTVRNPKYQDTIITLRMLLLQTSSINDGYDDENPLYDNIKKGYNGVNGTHIKVSLKDLLTNPSSPYYSENTFNDYKPGTKFCYSNFGCGIMACIIEKVSNMGFNDFLEQNLFNRLDIDASFLPDHIKNKNDIASFYSFNDSIKETNYNYISSLNLFTSPIGDNFRGPAGGLFIRPIDLIKIFQMILNNGRYKNIKILSKDTIDTIYQLNWIGYPNDDDYRGKALQMQVYQDLLLPLRGHNGCAYGVRSYLIFSLKHKIITCFMTNGIKKDSSKTFNNILNETQNFIINKYMNYNYEYAIVKNNIIYNTYRTIIDKDIVKDNYIKVINLCDALDLCVIYNDNINTLKINNININDFKLINNTPYININDLDKLNIKVNNNKYLLLTKTN